MTRHPQEPARRARTWRVMADLAVVLAVVATGVSIARASEAQVVSPRATTLGTAITASVTAPSLARTAASSSSNPHGPYGPNSDSCATCHRAHTSKNRNLLPNTAPQSRLCFTCHDGTGSAQNVKADYTDPSVPANDAATRSYYRHDTQVVSSHTSSESNEFGGVLNRHTECSDCHNPHMAGAAGSTSSPAGVAWSASGALAGVSGVSVVNGAAGSAPAFTFLDGATNPITAEYQLCFKCHTSFTVQLSNAGMAPSLRRHDLAVEFNPSNVSTHPVEAAGKNQTAKMALSLSGASPYKRWTFTPGSTVRCTNCHTSGTRYGATPAPAAGASLPTHTSSWRGLLLQKYENRVLKSANTSYTASDFALCYLCHTDTPFSSSSTTATNFSLHRLHVSQIDGKGNGGTDINTPFAGESNALCAECHFRIHSTGDQPTPNARLVTFAPNVTDVNGTLSWTSGGLGRGTCTLECHGQEHRAYTYP